MEQKNLMEGLLEEISRVKEMVIEYKLLPSGAGNLAAAFMKLDIKKAINAINNEDTVRMIKLYKALKEYEN